MLGQREHYALMEMFEKEYTGQRTDKENKELWAKGYLYQDGHTNTLFLAYRKGYAFAKCLYNTPKD